MNFVSVSAMIDALSRLPANVVLCVTEEGYYSYGTEYADCFVPALVGEDATGAPLYAIGHSVQNP